MGCLIACVGANGRSQDDSSELVVPWWSFTKTLIAACVLRLAERSGISLDSCLDGRGFTLRQVLQNRAGLANYGGLGHYHEAVARGDEPWTDEELIRRLDGDRLRFAPDTGWAYSNLGYLLLRRWIERESGLGFAEALKLHVLMPLGVPRARVASSVADMRDTAFEGGWHYHPGWVYHGLVIGPVVDAALALHRILHGDLLSPVSRRLCWTITRSVGRSKADPGRATATDWVS